MNSTDLLEFWRAQISDEQRPYLWSDDEAWVYMDQAQKQLCRWTEGIPDASTPDVVTVPVETGEIFAQVHASILTFRQAVLLSSGNLLDILNHTDVRKWDNASGNVTAMIVGLERNKVRWDKTPTVDDEVTLLVHRLPLCDIEGPDQAFEVDAWHIPQLTYWMSHLAFQKPDTETFDKKAAERAYAQFKAYCDQVAAEQNRYKQKPRSIVYGGI